MKTMKKRRLLSFALALVFVFSLLPSVGVKAVDGAGGTEVDTVLIELHEPVIGENANDADVAYSDNRVWVIPNQYEAGDPENGYKDYMGSGLVLGWSDSTGSHFDGAFQIGETYYYTFVLNGQWVYDEETGTDTTYDVTENTVVNVNGKAAKMVYKNSSDYGNYLYYQVTYSFVPVVYTVSFETGEGSKVDLQEVEGGKTATKPETNPTLNGYTFGGWYADEAWETEFDFSQPITKDTVVFAKWVKNPEYTILDGANSTVNEGEDLKVRASGDLDNCTDLLIDDVSVKADATLTAGSTIATIKAAFLSTLKEGEHTLTFVYKDGKVSTKFTLIKKAAETVTTTEATTEATPATVVTTEAAKTTTTTASPKTGDAAPIAFMSIAMLMSLAGIVVLRKKEK